MRGKSEAMMILRNADVVAVLTSTRKQKMIHFSEASSSVSISNSIKHE